MPPPLTSNPDLLETLLRTRLTDELGDTALAAELGSILFQETLIYQAPERPVEGARLVLAFTFGNRMLPNGNRAPGPVNEALAEIAAQLHRRTGAAILAQWEVAEALGPDIQVTPIYPARDQRGEPIYFGTQPAAAEMFRLADTSGPALVVAFADHLRRAVMAARANGFDAYAPAGITMPSTYDPESGQAWCRTRLGYLLHDLMLRLADRRAAIVGAPWI